MRIFDLFLNRNKKSFKSSKKVKEQNISTDDIQKLLESSNDPVVEMFKQIQRYKNLKKQILARSNIEELDISQSEILAIIEEYMLETIDEIPSGIVIPIKTNFKINGKEQSLLIGKELMCIGKFYVDNGEKLKRGIKKQDKIALFIDSSNINDHKDFNKNIRIYVDDNNSTFTNLIADTFLEDNWSTCRFSTVELTFDNNYNHSPVEQFSDEEVSTSLFKYLPTLEKEMTTSISDFLKEKAQYFSETLKISNTSSKEDSPEVTCDTGNEESKVEENKHDNLAQ